MWVRAAFGAVLLLACGTAMATRGRWEPLALQVVIAGSAVGVVLPYALGGAS